MRWLLAALLTLIGIALEISVGHLVEVGYIHDKYRLMSRAADPAYFRYFISALATVYSTPFIIAGLFIRGAILIRKGLR